MSSVLIVFADFRTAQQELNKRTNEGQRQPELGGCRLIVEPRVTDLAGTQVYLIKNNFQFTLRNTSLNCLRFFGVDGHRQAEFWNCSAKLDIATGLRRFSRHR